VDKKSATYVMQKIW